MRRGLHELYLLDYPEYILISFGSTSQDFDVFLSENLWWFRAEPFDLTANLAEVQVGVFLR